MECKQAVEMAVIFSPQGLLTPIWFTMEEYGERYEINRVLDISPGCSRKHGVLGMRYKCRVHGKVVVFVLEHDRWYLDN